MERIVSLLVVFAALLGLAPGQVVNWNGASTASDSTTGPWLAGEIHVINTRNASLGQGLLVAFVAECRLARRNDFI